MSIICQLKKKKPCKHQLILGSWAPGFLKFQVGSLCSPEHPTPGFPVSSPCLPQSQRLPGTQAGLGIQAVLRGGFTGLWGHSPASSEEGEQ